MQSQTYRFITDDDKEEKKTGVIVQLGTFILSITGVILVL